MAFIDTHLFGSFNASDPSVNRYVGRFTYESPRETAAYKTHLAAGKRAETFDGAIYEDSVHKLQMLFSDTTPDLLSANVNATLNAIAPGVDWYFQAYGVTNGYTAAILDVEHSETYTARVDGRAFTVIDFTITCEPGWKRPETTATLSTAPTSLPGIITASDILGSMPTGFRALLTYDQATTMQALGIRHGLATNATQDYQGTADADALSGESAQGTMDADGTALGTPTTLDSNVLRGWWLPIARVEQPDATPGDTTYFATSTVAASGGMAGTQSYVTASVPATVQNAFQKVVLPPLPIPGGAIPALDTDSGWNAEISLAENTADDGTLTLTSASPDVLHVQQTFAGFAGRITAIEYTLDVAPSSTLFNPILYIYEGTTLRSTQQMNAAADLTIGTHKVPLTTPIASATGTWSFLLQLVGLEPFTVGFAFSNGDYAAGALTTPSYGTGESAGDDLTFKVYGQTATAFNSAVAISAANAGAGTGKLDTVALLPYDEYSVVTTRTAAADEGVLIDAMTDAPTIYGASKAGGIEALDQALTDPQGTPRVWPGDSAIVVDGDTANAVPGGCDLVLYYQPTYKTPYGG